jgi:hypothetical protein
MQLFLALRLCRESLFPSCLPCNGAIQSLSPIPTPSDIQRSGLLNPPVPFPTPPQPQHPRLIWPSRDAAAILSAKSWLRMLIRAPDIITNDQNINTGMFFSTKCHVISAHYDLGLAENHTIQQFNLSDDSTTCKDYRTYLKSRFCRSVKSKNSCLYNHISLRLFSLKTDSDTNLGDLDLDTLSLIIDLHDTYIVIRVVRGLRIAPFVLSCQ